VSCKAGFAINSADPATVTCDQCEPGCKSCRIEIDESVASQDPLVNCTYLNKCNTDDQCKPMKSAGLCALYDLYSFCEDKLTNSIDIDCPSPIKAKCISAGQRNGEVQRVCTNCDTGVKLPNGDCANTCDIGVLDADNGICYCAATTIMQMYYTYTAEVLDLVEGHCAIIAELTTSVPDNCASIGLNGNCTGCAKDYSLNLMNGHEAFGTCI
jgi:hypothetical protein